MLILSQGMQLPTITTFPQNNKAWINWKDLGPQETLHRSKVIIHSSISSSQFYHKSQDKCTSFEIPDPKNMQVSANLSLFNLCI